MIEVTTKVAWTFSDYVENPEKGEKIFGFLRRRQDKESEEAKEAQEKNGMSTEDFFKKFI